MRLREIDLTLRDIDLHCYAGGKGYPILMLHGSGTGSSSLGNWHAVIEPLADRYKILAGDLIGYGKSGQKKREPYFDIKLWLRQAQFLLDKHAPLGPVGVIGHSLSGFFALKLAARNPRIDKVLVTGSLGIRYDATPSLEAGWSFPESEAAFKSFYSQVVADRSLITPEFLQNRMAILTSGNYSTYFKKMFEGDKQRYLDQCVLSDAEFKRIKCQVLMVHGAEDQMVPFDEVAVPMAKKLRNVDLIRLGNCGHGPAMDRPATFLDLARHFFG